MSNTYFFTWTTYGAWLPGDARGWFRTGSGFCVPNPARVLAACLRMTEAAIVLNDQQRQLVETTVVEHCRIRGWALHACSCRTNHVHVLLTADESRINIPREQLKAWCTRRLKGLERGAGGNSGMIRDVWWTERGWDEYVDSESSIARVIDYINEQQ